MKKFLMIITAFNLTANVAAAQETVIFRKEKGDVSEKKKKTGDENIIKIAPLAFISGNVPVYFEREITPFLGLQVGAGITTKNYIREIFAESDLTKTEAKETNWSDGTKNTYTNENTLDGGDQRKSKAGTYFSVEPRIFFESEGLEGNFIGISLSRGKYKSNANKIKTGPSINFEPTFTNAVFAEYENISDLMVTFGSQTLYDRISLEYSTGVGLRKIEGSRYAYGRDNLGNYIDGVSVIDKTKIAFNFSLKVGYHF